MSTIKALTNELDQQEEEVVITSARGNQTNDYPHDRGLVCTKDKFYENIKQAASNVNLSSIQSEEK